VDGLIGVAYRVHQTHTAAIKCYEGLKHGGDAADATTWHDCYQKDIVIRVDNGEHAICRANGSESCSVGRHALRRWRTSLPLQTGGRLASALIQRLTTEQVDMLSLLRRFTSA
jgi:hypothetical protein